MKLCRLKLKNLNSFRTPVDINFQKSPLDDASLVAITGPTGAGKTTLLDAICVVLYGKTPRLSGTKNQHPRHLISHGEEEGFAEVYFEANKTRYHATWSIKRNGSPKGQLLDDSGKLITTKVAQEVESILGLDFDAFKRSVMLAQGEFAAFLKASKEERRTILEATAGIHIYDILRQALNDKVKEVKAVKDALDDAINKIPEASREQLSVAETELDRLIEKGKALGEQSQQIQEEKDRETKRTEDFEKLQSSEKRQKELLDRQPEIDTFQAERENANRAKNLRPEKQVFDTATSDLESADEAFRVARTEKMEADKQVETDQADYGEKESAYQEASGEYDRQTKVYTEAKSDVERAGDRFKEANNRTPDLTNLGKQINILENQLTDRETEQAGLQGQIQEAQRFLDENPLPSNRRHRLTEAAGLLTKLGLQHQQLATASANQEDYAERVSSLENKLETLSNNRQEYLAKEVDAASVSKNADDKFNRLLAAGTSEEWDARKQQAVKAQPMAEKYEAANDDFMDAEDHLRELNKAKAELDTELGQIEAALMSQAEVCQSAVEAVERCETERESALLANPINQLRQHLHAGEPCLVCGATEYPGVDAIEPEGEERLQDAETALAEAKASAQMAETQRQTLKTKQAQTQQDKHNTTEQIEECNAGIETLQNEIAQHLEQWQDIYPDTGVSLEWTAEQIANADTAIAALGEADQACTQASHSYQMVSQQLENCENNIVNEKKSLSETEKQLQNISDAHKVLKEDIDSTKENFWNYLPEVFHDVTPKEAVKQFSNKIEEVATRKDELGKRDAKLNLLNAEIHTDRSGLEDMKERHEALQVEIDRYQCEGKAFLDTVREKTDGLETEDEINTAIKNLEAELQAKQTERDAADQQLRDSRNLLTEKQTAHGICEDRHTECGEKFDTAYRVYTDKLRDAGFDSLEAHDSAFRDEAQMQGFTDQIDAHEDEKQQLELEITKLRTRFEETPFDPEALGQIEAQVEEIEAQLQAAQLRTGAQQQKIDDLKDALERREALADELHAAQQELERWQRLQEIIPRNDLRDFALEIMFKQMGSIANVQLNYLTSERYQLKVETIGDLTVIDRWNANEERPVETLSGGESFLTSLALALALADLSRGRAQLNSLFLDEGFGTLDTETLDTAIAALEGLRMQGRSIFLISHIQELTRRLPVKIEVRKRGNGSSYIPS